MPKKSPPHNTQLVLETTLVDPNFALAEIIDPILLTPIPNPAFAALIDPLGTLPGGPYDYAYVSKRASTPGKIEVGDSLESLNGIISTGNGKDVIDLSGSTGNNLVYSGNGVDKVAGGAGNDMIFGQNGNDELKGGAGNDAINGGNGKDTLIGGQDTGVFSNAIDPITGLAVFSFTAGDVLTGGKGSDTFHFKLGDGVDHITDFRVRQDTLELEGIAQAQLQSLTVGGDLYIGLDDGAGGLLTNSVIRIDGVTDIDTLLNSQSILFV